MTADGFLVVGIRIITFHLGPVGLQSSTFHLGSRQASTGFLFFRLSAPVELLGFLQLQTSGSREFMGGGDIHM